MEGLVTVTKILLADGKEMSTQRAVELGWILPYSKRAVGWDVAREEVELGPNLFVDSGRQMNAFAFGNKSPLSQFTCQQFGIGTGSLPPNVTDVALQLPLNFYLGGPLKPISGVDFPTPFVARVEFVIAATEANGYLITEMGLFSGNGTMFARRVHAGINKTSDFAPVLGWRIRF